MVISASQLERLRALGANGLRLMPVLDRAATACREDRRQARWAIAYPLAVGLLGVVGTVWLVATKLPLFEDVAGNAPATGEPVAPAGAADWARAADLALAAEQAAPAPRSSLRLPLTTAGLLAAAAVPLVILSRRRSFEQRRLRACVACELLAEMAGSPGDDAAREEMVAELCDSAGLTTQAGPLMPPLARHVAGGPAADLPARLRQVAAFYHGRDEVVSVGRNALPPVIGLLLAGIVVLAYSSTLFVPLVRVIEAVTTPPAATHALHSLPEGTAAP